MDQGGKIKDDKEAQKAVSKWCKDQKFQRSTEDCYEELGSKVSHISARSLGRYLPDQWKVFGIGKKGEKRSKAAALMSVARSGGRMKDDESVEDDGSIGSPQKRTYTFATSSLLLKAIESSCLSFTGRATVSPPHGTTFAEFDLYKDGEIRLDTWHTKWTYKFFNNKDVEDRIGLNIGANGFINPTVELIEEGLVLEIKSELPSCRWKNELDLIYNVDVDKQMAIVTDSKTTPEQKQSAMMKISALNARKTAQMDAIQLDFAERKDAWHYGVYRIRLPEACEVEIPLKVVKKDKGMMVLDVDLIIKKEKTYHGSAAVEMASSSPAKA